MATKLGNTTKVTNNNNNNTHPYVPEGMFGVVVNIGGEITLSDKRVLILQHPLNSEQVLKVLNLNDNLYVPMPPKKGEKIEISLDDL